MKTIFLFLLLTTLTVKAQSPNEMLVMIGAVKYYNENCAGLNAAGSLSDEKFNAVAFVVLELGEKNEDEKGEYGTTF
jgi:hypothetical protein